MTDTRRSMLLKLSAIPALGAASEVLAASGTSTAGAAGAPTLAGGAVATGSRAAPRGARGLFTRLPDFNLESYQDYLYGRGIWIKQIAAISQQRGEAILRSRGIDPTKPSDIPLGEVVAMLQADPVIARQTRLGLDNTYDSFVRLRDYFHANGSYYEEMLAASDKAGPGVLEVNPGMDVPDYTKHEIHNQVGGYMGDPFAGMIYFYGTLALNDAANEQDNMFDAIAKSVPLPPDGKVRRILDNGTGPGQLATSMKRRFPDAEVWGIDVSGPMVRYAHHRANVIGLNVNFAQRLAEDNKFPDNYFDMIVSSSFHHELTAEASKQVFNEVRRVLRPGGIYRPADSGINGYSQLPQGKVATYLAYRLNHEVWMLEWSGLDRLGAMKAAGLKVDTNGIPPADGGAGWWLKSINWIATKA